MIVPVAYSLFEGATRRLGVGQRVEVVPPAFPELPPVGAVPEAAAPFAPAAVTSQPTTDP